MKGRLRALAFAIALVLSTGGSAAAQAPTPDPASEPVVRAWDPFFDDSVLHEVRLAINSRDWRALQEHFLDNTYYPADFRWGQQTVRNIGIRSRGGGSRSGAKPGLRVDFNRYVTDQQFLGLKSFILRNQTQDPSNMHERISMLLFRRMGLPAPREAHAKLYINNAYAGLYTIVQSVDKTFLKDTFNEDEGYLYKYDYPSDAPPYYFEDRGPDPDTYVPVPFKPETHETEPRPEFIAQLVQVINEASDATFRTAIAEYLDLKAFIRHVAVENFVADNDGFNGDWGINNFYFYQSEQDKRFTFIAWDKSEAFKSGPAYSIFHNITGVPDEQKNRLMARALASPDLYKLYLDTLLAVAASASELEPESVDGHGWMSREVDREYLQIREAALTDPQKIFNNEEFEAAVFGLGLFARQRSDQIVRQVSDAQSALR